MKKEGQPKSAEKDARFTCDNPSDENLQLFYSFALAALSTGESVILFYIPSPYGQEQLLLEQYSEEEQVGEGGVCVCVCVCGRRGEGWWRGMVDVPPEHILGQGQCTRGELWSVEPFERAPGSSESNPVGQNHDAEPAAAAAAAAAQSHQNEARLPTGRDRDWR